MRPCVVFGLGLLCLCIGLAACQRRARTPAPRPPASRPAPSAPSPRPASAPTPSDGDPGYLIWQPGDRLMPVLELAQAQDKPVMLTFYASWCAPCKIMEEQVFAHPDFYRYVNARYLCFRADYDSPAGRRIADIYEVDALPQVLFLTPQGVVTYRQRGGAGLQTLLEAAGKRH
ncbi:MAG: thioredoxin family protein [Saprospiraceae bacterium]